MLELDAHVRAREERRGAADERRQRDQKHVKRIDEELLASEQQVAIGNDPDRERACGYERGSAQECIQARRETARAEDSEHDGATERNRKQEYELHAISPP